MNIFLSTVTAFFIGFIITPIVILALKRANFIEVPGGRKIHSGSVPSMGGVAIVVATFFGLIAWLDFDQIVQSRYFLVAFAIMFSVGLRDDLIELSAFQKLLGQCIPAFFVIVMADIRVSGFYGFLGIYELPYVVSVVLTFVLLIVLTNSFNLIDGADGLAGTLSLISFSVLGFWFLDVGLEAYSLISFTLVGGILSFLVFNWHPAKIFMGDTGSLSLGFALTALVILFVDKNGTMGPWEGYKLEAPIAAGLALLIVPVYDTLRIFIKRMSKGKSPLKPDKSHVHHFLIRMGLGHDKVALILGGVKCFFIFLAFGLSGLSDHILLPLMAIMIAVMGIWMDSKTLERVKVLTMAAPPVLENSRHSKKRKEKKRPQIASDILKRDEINMN
ncbi:Undecaprenyl-phosphate N-acetylglucosaminyl 1-phosphate transferase [Lunatimonas lonarensis]|uniref:Undecaprenyl-phosphate N-acetylglucosaminyl 1-phosphate transferase n=1 Tax=Lunatimonas lonarensis TaxID=1232681 RepID=R7ZTP5_9BACT|nr:MraY family glycosyltransferase [Lunatimonas lonarensis]EON77495.1 Undecaprenyl-phosphate N-acetylglucosaminyl 1-phosphate transferase [Lunatimonas lonarensis]